MISNETLCEVKKYIEENLNVQVSFRPWLKGMIADVQFPYGGIVHIGMDKCFMDDMWLLKTALEVNILGAWKEVLKKK